MLFRSGSGPDIEVVQKAIDEFFTKNLLFWIEVLSLMGNLDVCVHALNNIQQWYILVSFVQDVYLYNLYLLFLGRRLLQVGG